MLNFLEASSAAARSGEEMQPGGTQQHRLEACQKVPGTFPWTEENQ